MAYKILRNIIILLVIAGLGLSLGFVSGMYWASNQIVENDQAQQRSILEAAEADIRAQTEALNQVQEQLAQVTAERDYYKNLPTPTRIPVATVAVQKPVKYYTGEDLLQAVNKYRREHGVPELQLKSGLCQLSSRRLGELIDLGKLDNHAGFENYFKTHAVSDLGVTNVAENLASGYPSAWEAVMGWDSSPPHRTFLLSDGSYKYGCASANLNFAVLIAGF